MKRMRLASALAALGTLGVAGCSSAGSTSGDESAGKFGLPRDVAAKGELQVATYAAFPPLEYKNSAGDIVGAEIDLMRALGERLGVTVRFSSVPFEQIIPGLLANRYDLAISDMSDTAERRQQVDFVDYATAFTAIVVPKGNPGKVASLDSLGGLPVAAQTSSSQYSMLQSLGRALAMEPSPMLFDEPTSALDPELADGRITRLGTPAEMLHEVDGRLAVVGTRDGSMEGTKRP